MIPHNKQYSLQKCVPFRGNGELAEMGAANLTEAIEKLQPFCPVPLDSKGYAKDGSITYVICESFDCMETRFM